MTAYSNFTDQTKIYIYPSSRKFYPQEMEELHSLLQSFITNWTQVQAEYKIVYQRFLVFFIEEDAQITTEMMDTLASFILKLEQKYNIILLDKINVCFKQGEYVQYKDMKKFKTLIKNKSISAKTIVFNNFVQTKEEFENLWEIPISDSYLSHLIK